MNKNESIAEKALEAIVEDITDHVFSMIQDDRDLMQSYIEQVTTDGRDTVNRTIGKYVKNRLNLTNKDERGNDPHSTLISSYEKHGLKDI